jgi:predicted secreted protein
MFLLQIGRGYNAFEVSQAFDGATWGCGGTLNLGGTTITQLNNIVPPKFESDDIDVTTHDNTNGFRTYIKGMSDAGEIECEGNFDYTKNYAKCYELMTTRTLQTVTITMPTLPTATKFECSGYVKSLETEDPVDDKIPFTCTIKVSGKPTITQ